MSVGVNYLGESKRRVPIAVASLIVQLVLAVTLIPTHGAVGGAVATSVAYVIYVPGHLLICRDVLSMSLRPLATTVVRSLIAAAAAAGVLALIGTSDLSLLDVLLGGPAGLLVYVGVLFALRELRPADAARAYEALTAGIHKALKRPPVDER